MQTTVAVIGGGLAGLYAARLLDAANIDFQLFEARDRLGGRILSAGHDGNPSEDGFDLGPSWFWPGMQPKLAALTRELGLLAFPQHSDGDVLFERTAKEAVQRVSSMRQEPESTRIAGGTGALVAALAAGLQPERLHLQCGLTGAALVAEDLELTFSTQDNSLDIVRANQVIVTMPPRLAAETVSFTPALDTATAARWQATPHLDGATRKIRCGLRPAVLARARAVRHSPEHGRAARRDTRRDHSFGLRSVIRVSRRPRQAARRDRRARADPYLRSTARPPVWGRGGTAAHDSIEGLGGRPSHLD